MTPMTVSREQVLTAIDAAFAAHPRPQQFIRGSCRCDECLEHEALMQTLDRDRLPLEPLNSPAWDPLCFAANEALAWLLPGLVRLLLDHTDDYLQQFVFHIGQPERLDYWSPAQARALQLLLDYLLLNAIDAIERNLVINDVGNVYGRLDQRR